MLLFFGDYSDYLIFLNCIKNLNWRLTNEVMGDCGVAGVAVKTGDPHHAYKLLKYMLHGLQHRGQLSCGVTVSSPRSLELQDHKNLGLVHAVLNGTSLDGYSGLGHVRYATSGIASEGTSLDERALRDYETSVRSEIQPFHFRHANPSLEFSFAFNGQLVNDSELRKYFQDKKHYRFGTKTDTEVLMHVIAEELQVPVQNDLPDLRAVFTRVVNRIKGAYCIVFLDGTGRFAALRDPYGFHPLAYVKNEAFIAVASETSAFDSISSIAPTDVGFIQPGQMLLHDYPYSKELQKFSLVTSSPAFCTFELLYFMYITSLLREDSLNSSVHHVREVLGQRLALIEPLRSRPDFNEFTVVAVPDTGKTAAEAYANALNLEFSQGAIVRDSYVGRAFITDPLRRDESLELKYRLVPDLVRDKKLIVFDDSLVRGDASRLNTTKLRSRGAQEIHFRVTFPPVTHPCRYGIDFAKPEKLLTHQVGDYNSLEELEHKVASAIGVDSFKYPSTELLLEVASEALGLKNDSFCTACVTGNYPIK